jgi:hypothetical protein
MMGRLFNGEHNLRVRSRKIILELEPGLGGRVGQYSTEAQSGGSNLLWPLPVSRAVFINSSNEMHRRLYPEIPPAAATLGFQLDLFEVREAGELPGAIAAAKARGAEALFIFADPIFAFPPNRVPDLAAQAGLPSISFICGFAQAGGLISYGPDFPALARLGAHYVDRVLKGAKPAELPIAHRNPGVPSRPRGRGDRIRLVTSGFALHRAMSAFRGSPEDICSQ